MSEDQIEKSATRENEVLKEKIGAAPELDALKDVLSADKFNKSCGGSIDLGKPVELCIRKDAGSGVVIQFPPSAEEEKQLLSACEPASFGKGSEEVLDPEIRQALRLASDQFYLNFALQSTSVLDEIKNALFGHFTGLIELYMTARLDKLNVYSTYGFFKEHRDTPKANNVLGTLVLVLPSAFEGGELVVQKSTGIEGETSANSSLFTWPEKSK